MNSSQRAWRPVLVALALVGALGLSGCLPTISGAVGGSDGGGQSGTTGGQTVEVESDEMETDGGDAPAPGIPSFTELPASFPSDAVPLADGEVTMAVEFGTGWTVMLGVDDLAAAFAQGSQRLQGAGFRVLVEQAGGAGSVGSYTDDEYDVQLTASDSTGDGPGLTYLVTLHP